MVTRACMTALNQSLITGYPQVTYPQGRSELCVVFALLCISVSLILATYCLIDLFYRYRPVGIIFLAVDNSFVSRYTC